MTVSEQWLCFWLRGTLPAAWQPQLPEIKPRRWMGYGALASSALDLDGALFLPHDGEEWVTLYRRATGGNAASRAVGSSVARHAHRMETL